MHTINFGKVVLSTILIATTTSILEHGKVGASTYPFPSNHPLTNGMDWLRLQQGQSLETEAEQNSNESHTPFICQSIEEEILGNRGSVNMPELERYPLLLSRRRSDYPQWSSQNALDIRCES